MFGPIGLFLCSLSLSVVLAFYGIVHFVIINILGGENSSSLRSGFSSDRLNIERVFPSQRTLRLIKNFFLLFFPLSSSPLFVLKTHFFTSANIPECRLPTRTFFASKIWNGTRSQFRISQSAREGVTKRSQSRGREGKHGTGEGNEKNIVKFEEIARWAEMRTGTKTKKWIACPKWKTIPLTFSPTDPKRIWPRIYDTSIKKVIMTTLPNNHRIIHFKPSKPDKHDVKIIALSHLLYIVHHLSMSSSMTLEVLFGL